MWEMNSFDYHSEDQFLWHDFGKLNNVLTFIKIKNLHHELRKLP